MTTVLVIFDENVEKEGYDVIREGLMIEVEFRYEAEVFAVYCRDSAVDLIDGDDPISVDLVSRRTSDLTA
jgi:hypothetical protein